MTARLHRIHGILRAGNVPCALATRPGLGTVLHAGTPEHGPWDVLLRDTGRELTLHHSDGVIELSPRSTDIEVATAIKVQVVQAWADRGDPEAKAVMARLQSAGQVPMDQPQRTAYPAPLPVLQLFDPLLVAEQLFRAANEMGWAYLTGRPAAVGFSMIGPWGSYRMGYTRR